MSPLETMASAAARTFAALTSQPKQFQLFHPSGGVSARVSPQMILNNRSTLPNPFSALKVTRCVPFSGSVPVIWPDFGSRLRPAGRLRAPYVIGRWPETGMVNRKGEPGRTPNTLGPLMRGRTEALGVRTDRKSTRLNSSHLGISYAVF